jgi:hypothetical protein
MISGGVWRSRYPGRAVVVEPTEIDAIDTKNDPKRFRDKIETARSKTRSNIYESYMAIIRGSSVMAVVRRTGACPIRHGTIRCATQRCLGDKVNISCYRLVNASHAESSQPSYLGDCE